MQVDKICTFGSEVIDVESLCSYWHPQNLVFQFFLVLEGLNKIKKTLKTIQNLCPAGQVTYLQTAISQKR